MSGLPSPGGLPPLELVTGQPAEAGNTRVFLDGSRRSHALLHTAAVGCGTYQPGWRWSVHVQQMTGKAAENHIGYVIAGRMRARDPAGNEAEIGPGHAFELPPGSDAWVVGDEACVALDFIPLGQTSV